MDPAAIDVQRGGQGDWGVTDESRCCWWSESTAAVVGGLDHLSELCAGRFVAPSLSARR